jgi:hypothetical protein
VSDVLPRAVVDIATGSEPGADSVRHLAPYRPACALEVAVLLDKAHR